MDIILMAFLTFISVHIIATDELISNYENHTDEFEIENRSRILSRRKRFLVFPDGSSFQLVFCTQNPGFLMLGNTIWFGNTAALAWELPTDPGIFNILKEHKKYYPNRRQDSSKHILYLDEDGKLIGKVPYKRRPIVNPAFAKRSVDGKISTENTLNKELIIKQMHQKEVKTNRFLDLEKDREEFHRDTRLSLYGKVEKIFDGFRWNGRECVLRLLCETRRSRGQGTFLEEILKATFTLPKGREFASLAHKEYDIAHGTDGDCTQMYPNCKIYSDK